MYARTHACTLMHTTHMFITHMFMHTNCSKYLCLQVSVRLAQFHNSVKKLVREACENALKAEGFVPDPVDIGMCWLAAIFYLY